MRPPAGLRLVDVEEAELTIEKLVAGGDGFGRFEGVPVFVPRSAPGDRLRVKIVERHADYGRAEIVELLTPGPGRRAAPCPHFDRCGGCDLQHLDEAHQVRYKVEAVVETLRRLAGIALPPEVAVVAREAWGYRLRAQMHVVAGAASPRVGYFARRSHELVEVERCPVLDPALEEAVVGLGARLPENPPSRIALAVGDDGAVTASPVVTGLPHGEVTRRVGDFVYTYDSRCFFQGHRWLLGDLVAHVVGMDGGALAYDLYGGVGLFALPLARRYERVVLVESDRIATRYAQKNARVNKISNLEVVARAVEGVAAAIDAAADRVVVDPPRAGLGSLVRRALLDRAPRRVTYVSCHPATLARDLATLRQRYRLESLAFIDLFPQAGDLEVVAQLALADGPPPGGDPVKSES